MTGGPPPGWTPLPPASAQPLADAAALFRTDPARALARGYLEMVALAGGVPSKRGFDPTLAAAALPYVSLLALAADGRCVHRLAGEEVKTRLGFDPTGTDYYATLPPARRSSAARAMRRAVEVPCGYRVDEEQRFADGSFRMVEALVLPLRSEEAGIEGFVVVSSHTTDARRRSGGGTDPGRRAEMVGSIVVRRDLLDLGHGVDDGLFDLVPSAR